MPGEPQNSLICKIRSELREFLPVPDMGDCNRLLDERGILCCSQEPREINWWVHRKLYPIGLAGQIFFLRSFCWFSPYLQKINIPNGRSRVYFSHNCWFLNMEIHHHFPLQLSSFPVRSSVWKIFYHSNLIGSLSFLFANVKVIKSVGAVFHVEYFPEISHLQLRTSLLSSRPLFVALEWTHLPGYLICFR